MKGMKIVQHPRMYSIAVGDEVYCYPVQLFALVVETFPAAVCVRLGILSVTRTMDLIVSPQLWRADDIENLSVCRYCSNRDDLHPEVLTGIPFRICTCCRETMPTAKLDYA